MISIQFKTWSSGTIEDPALRESEDKGPDDEILPKNTGARIQNSVE